MCSMWDLNLLIHMKPVSVFITKICFLSKSKLVSWVKIIVLPPLLVVLMHQILIVLWCVLPVIENNMTVSRLTLFISLMLFFIFPAFLLNNFKARKESVLLKRLSSMTYKWHQRAQKYSKRGRGRTAFDLMFY